MSEIADELRGKSYMWTDRDSPMVGLLLDIADRIDAEMLNLPHGMDGVPIRVGGHGMGRG